MDSDNNKKITWTRSVKNDTNQTPPGEPQGAKSDAPLPVMDISTQAADRANQTKGAVPESDISDLKSEIEAALASGPVPTVDPDQNIVKPRDERLVDLEAPDQEIIADTSVTTSVKNSSDVQGDILKANEAPASSTLDQVAQDNHEALVASLKNDINSEIDAAKPAPEDPATGRPTSTGIEQTYYSDLSKAMSSNEPATMSELIRKSRFEQKESKILSPKSRRNVAFIAGTVILLLASIGIISSLFGGTKQVEFITEERVSSLVRSNLDTGINTTGLESARIKQAIRDVIEMKIPEDSINQIYYVEGDGLGNLRRLGVKDIFEKTDNETPTLLYDNIENTFTHGVYKTDRNYPFIIMKALSYDRAFQGMLEWEPTMIDDLATYLDLPPEATDRSLIKDGFEDDLINNKNVRVARFLPREVDRRGILDFISGGGNEPEAPQEQGADTIEQGEPLSVFNRVLAYLTTPKKVYAQGTWNFGDGNNNNTERFCYQIRKECVLKNRTCRNAAGQVVPYDPNDQNQTCVSAGTRVDYNPNDTNQICSDIRLNDTAFPATPELESDTDNYSCTNTITQGNAIGQISVTDDVCFDPATGDRIETEDITSNPYAFCFPSYRCYRYTCKVGNTDVGVQGANQPGAVCGEQISEGPKYHESDPRYNETYDAGQKICRQFTGLLSVDNIQNTLLCFDESGRYLPNYTEPGNTEGGVTCIPAISRQETVCVNRSQQIVRPTDPGDKICFEPTATGLSNLQCGDMTAQELRQYLGEIVYRIRFLAGLANLIGVSNQDVQNMYDAAQALEDLAYGNIPEVNGVVSVGASTVIQIGLVIQDIEVLVQMIDQALLSVGIGQLPDFGLDSIRDAYEQLRNVIDVVTCSLGIANTVQWSTLGPIPQGFTIYAGQTLPEMETIQQALVLMGLMDPVSVNGTLDLVTQDAISQLQLANALEVTGVLDPPTLELMQNIIDAMNPLEGGNSVYGDAAIINDYFIVTEGAISSDGTQILTMGAFNGAVQSLQVLLFAEGYNIPAINGLFDEQTCSALQEFQADQGLEIADPVSCTVSAETLEVLNEIIREKNYLGSGFVINPQGFLEGTGTLEGSFGPGVVDFEISEALADSLNEGDVVLMYMFLDEETILIARDQIVIDEVIKRRALDDIFE